MKFIVDYEYGKRIYKVQSGLNNPISYYVDKMLSEDISLISISGDAITIKYIKGFVLEIKNELALNNLNNSNDKYFEALKNKIYNHVKQYGVIDDPTLYKDKKVNRNKNSKIKSIAVSVASIGVAATILLSVSIQKGKSLKEEIVEEGQIVVDSSVLPVPTESYFLPLECENRYNTGKYQETEEYYGDTIKYYAERYGLPYELVCAQITQERPAIVDGVCNNPCQIDYSLHEGSVMKVPVYDKNGFTGTYDKFLITKELLDTIDGNIKVGAGYLRNNIDKYDSLATGLYSYNQGGNALKNACDVFGLNILDYLGDHNALKAAQLINRYYEVHFNGDHGDKNYLEHVLSYCNFEDRNNEVEFGYFDSGGKYVSLIVGNIYSKGVTR